MLVAILVTVALIALSWWYFYFYSVRNLAKIPGLFPLPLVGSALIVGSNTAEFFVFIKNATEKFNGVFKIFLGFECWVIISDPGIISEILASNTEITKSPTYNLLRPWLGDGLLLSDGEKWRQRRKLLTPCFHFEILEGFLQHIDNACGIFVDCLQQQTIGSNKGEPIKINLESFVNALSLDVICETSMGVKMNAQQTANHPYFNAVVDYTDLLMKRTFSPLLNNEAYFKWTSLYKPYLKCLQTLHSFTRNVIFNKEMELKHERVQTEKTLATNSIADCTTSIKRKKRALLDLLLNTDLDKASIQEEIDTFMFRGHDTTGSAICFTLYALATNPEIQRKLFEEIQNADINIPTAANSDIKIADLQKLEYLDRVIKESLRRYPSVPMVERILSKDTKIGDVIYPKGLTLNLFIYGMQNDPKVFADPERFDPDRFLPDRIKERHNFAYTPFSAGPRNCIGQKFALLELKMVIIRVMQSFELLPVAGFEPILGLSAILRSTNGILVQLKRRL